MTAVPDTHGNAWSGAADRRTVLSGAALFALALGLPAGALPLSARAAAVPPTARQRAMLHAVGQLVIPSTDTPGAADAGVTDFVVLALAHGLLGTGAPIVPAGLDPALARFVHHDGTFDHLAWLQADLDFRAGGDFLGADAPRRASLLADLDSQAFGPGAPSPHPSPWQAIKALILTGYYTSEIGGSQELRYDLVPGRFDPDLPLNAGDRAWSSDWTAVDFG